MNFKSNNTKGLFLSDELEENERIGMFRVSQMVTHHGRDQFTTLNTTRQTEFWKGGGPGPRTGQEN